MFSHIPLRLLLALQFDLVHFLLTHKRSSVLYVAIVKLIKIISPHVFIRSKQEKRKLKHNLKLHTRTYQIIEKPIQKICVRTLDLAIKSPLNKFLKKLKNQGSD